MAIIKMSENMQKNTWEEKYINECDKYTVKDGITVEKIEKKKVTERCSH